MSEATYRLVAGYCTSRALGPLSLKGKEAPVQAWEGPDGPGNPHTAGSRDRTRADTFRRAGRELQLLTDAFAQVCTGHGQVVFLVGEAGLGKSACSSNFHHLGTDATWLEGHAMSFGQSMAFHPLIDLLRRNFRLEEG